MLYRRGQSASSITGTIDQQMLSSLGLNPLGITDDELAAVKMGSEEAQLINAALEHVTLRVPVGLLRTQIYISKMSLFSIVPQDVLKEVADMKIHQRFHKIKSCITSPVSCQCRVCNKLDTWGKEWMENPNYENRKFVSLLMTCRQLDTTDAYNQIGGQLLLGITEFALHKAELHASQWYLECVHGARSGVLAIYRF